MSVETQLPATPATPVAAGTPAKARRALSTGQKLLGAIVALITMGLASYSFAGSYNSIVDLAKRHKVPLPDLVPLGIDGGLVGVVVLDLFATSIGKPIGWLRSAARLFTVGTVVVNGMAGWKAGVSTWENVQSVTLHIFAPFLFLVLVEAGRHLLISRLDGYELTDKIPVATWFLQPWPTFLIWRRMKLNKIGSRVEALDFEATRRRAIALLKVAYPGFRAWRKKAPADLVYDLLRGRNLPASVARVEAMRLSGTPDRKPVGDPSGTPDRKPSGDPGGDRPRTTGNGSSGAGGKDPSGASGKGGTSRSGDTSRGPSHTDGATRSGDPKRKPFEDMTKSEQLEERIRILRGTFGDTIPGINTMRETLKAAGVGVGHDGAVEIRDTLRARAGLPPLSASVNGTSHS
ncbi:DUF2637 domain-containing protein [Nonomuraea sp. NPDC023979]|uniref:DUF2637 domain-containing protein n=1 Tax=Nonomuraea sp. NPDC023979 TaxID=3154796 RepID=UPI0033ED93C8